MSTEKPETVRRFVVTHLSKKWGMRTLAHSQQGRYTYATEADAQAWIDEATARNTPERLKEFYGLPLEVRPCECYPVHFDPVGVWFDTEAAK